MTIATQLEETAAPSLIFAVNCLAGKQLSLRWRPCLSIYNLLLMARHQKPANACWLNECPVATTLLVFSVDNSLALGVEASLPFPCYTRRRCDLPAAAMPNAPLLRLAVLNCHLDGILAVCLLLDATMLCSLLDACLKVANTHRTQPLPGTLRTRFCIRCPLSNRLSECRCLWQTR